MSNGTVGAHKKHPQVTMKGCSCGCFYGLILFLTYASKKFSSFDKYMLNFEVF